MVHVRLRAGQCFPGPLAGRRRQAQPDGRGAGELGSWNYGNPREAVIIFCGGDLPEEAAWYTFQNSGITYTCPIENGRVLDVFVLPDTGDISSYPEEVLDQNGDPLDVRYEGDIRPEP